MASDCSCALLFLLADGLSVIDENTRHYMSGLTVKGHATGRIDSSAEEYLYIHCILLTICFCRGLIHRACQFPNR